MNQKVQGAQNADSITKPFPIILPSLCTVDYGGGSGRYGDEWIKKVTSKWRKIWQQVAYRGAFIAIRGILASKTIMVLELIEV